MCKTPSFVWVKRGPEYVQVPVPCDNCWYCRENYVSDWVGRCLCEASVSEVSVTLSLTYADPQNHLDLSHRVVNPWHFQLFMKRLRKAGHKVRYLVAGEYGELRDRAHFHAILFFKRLVDSGKPAPYLMDRAAHRADPTIAHPLSRQMPQEDMCHIREWPHGHVKTDWSASEKSVRYCCEYLRQDDKKSAWFSMSKKPPLGFEWFAAKAARNVELGVLPSSFEYMPPGGKPGKVYLMTGATRRDYLNMITKDRGERPRMSKWVRATFDKIERQAFVEASDIGKPWADDHFSARQPDLAKLLSRLRFEDFEQDQPSDKFGDEDWVRLAAYYGIENNGEAFEKFFRENPDFLDRISGTFVPWAQHVSGCACEACVAGRSPVDWRVGTSLEGKTATQTSWGPIGKIPRGGSERPTRSASPDGRRAPDRYDRQGKPLWGPEGRDYLGSAFARREAGDEAGEPEAE